MSCLLEQTAPDSLTTVTLTGFLWGSGKGALNRPAVGVVSSADATFVLNLGGANLSIAANFLKTTTHNRGGVLSDVAVRWFLNPSIVFLSFSVSSPRTPHVRRCCRRLCRSIASRRAPAASCTPHRPSLLTGSTSGTACWLFLLMTKYGNEEKPVFSFN